MLSTLFSLPPRFQATHSIELLWNVCVMTSAPFFFLSLSFFSHPVAHSVSVFYLSQVFLKPSRCCLLGGSHMPHAECFLWAVFELKTPGPRGCEFLIVFTEQASTIKTQSACPFVVCGRARLHSFHLVSKWLRLRSMMWGLKVKNGRWLITVHSLTHNVYEDT